MLFANDKRILLFLPLFFLAMDSIPESATIRQGKVAHLRHQIQSTIKGQHIVNYRASNSVFFTKGVLFVFFGPRHQHAVGYLCAQNAYGRIAVSLVQMVVILEGKL